MKAISSKSIDKETLTHLLIVSLAVSLLLPFYINIVGIVISIIGLFLVYRHDLNKLIGSAHWLNIFVLYNLFVSIFSKNLIGILLSLIFWLIGLFILIYQKYVKIETFISCLKIWLVGSIFLSIYALIVYLNYALSHGYGVFYIFKYAAVQTRAEATFFNANYYGLYCIFMIVVAIYFLVRHHQSKWKIISIVAIVMNVISIILTASRFFPITLIVTVLVMLFFIDRRWMRLFGVVGIVFVISIIIKPEIMPRLANLEEALIDRLALWRVGLSIFLTSPLFGRGALSYSQFYYLFTSESDMHSHSLYVELLANYGVIGVGIIIFGVISYLKYLVTFYKRSDLRPEFSVLIALISCVLFHGMIDFAIFWIQTGLLFLLIIFTPFPIYAKLPDYLNDTTRKKIKDDL